MKEYQFNAEELERRLHEFAQKGITELVVHLVFYVHCVVPPLSHDHLSAISSTSQRTPFGNFATSTQERAGSETKYFA